MSRLIIAGGGLAGCLTAMALAKRPDIHLLLIEQEGSFGGNHTWSFFDTDIDSEHRQALEDLIGWRWQNHDVHFPRRSRTIDIGYNSVRSAALDAAVKSTLRPDQYRLGASLLHVDAAKVRLADGLEIEADAVIDARGCGAVEGLTLGWQKFVGRIYEFPFGHRISRPVIMDATVEQIDGYRFIYFLPLSGSRLLIEDTYYSLSPVLDPAELEVRLDRVATRQGYGKFEVIEQESGVLPVVMGGRFDRFWPSHDPLPRLGVRGGFFHPTTSYSLPDAVATAAMLAKQRDFTSPALARFLREGSQKLWHDRAFFRRLNRMLFHAAAPGQAYKVLEHFYRLPQDVIARFYSGRLTPLDKVRIVSGKPPVPVSRALMAIGGRTA